MNPTEKKLRNQQELILVNAARKALDHGRHAEGLMFIERISGFWAQNLISLMIVICFSKSRELQKRAQSLFRQHLELCENVTQLSHAALWAKNPKRAYLSALPELKRLIDMRRKALEPVWDGVWHDEGLAGSRRSLQITAKHPNDVDSTNDCLVAATQVKDPGPWLDRYLSLGGSEDEPRYLKIFVARVAANGEKLTPQVKRMLKRYCEVANVQSARAFIRSITPVRLGAEGRDPDWKLARFALVIYSGWERLEHDLSDWMHIAESAMYLDNKMIQLLAMRGLAGLQRTPDAQEVFEQLIARHGWVRTTRNTREDIGPRPNPIWQSIYYRVPVDANARSILIAYSHAEEATF